MESPGYQHVGAGQHAQGVQIGRLLVIVYSGGAAGGPDVEMVGQRLHHRQDGAVLQERQLAGTEVVQQRAEWFRSNGHLRVQAPAAVGVELGHVEPPRPRGRRHGQ